MQSGFLSEMQDNSLSRTKCFFCPLFAKAGDFPFIIRGVVLAGFPGPVKISRAVLSHKSDNNARLFFLIETVQYLYFPVRQVESTRILFTVFLQHHHCTLFLH